MSSTNKSAKENDPCWKERQLVYKCLDANNYDKEKCEAHMLNGKYCKTFWSNVTKDRRTKGITPHLPDINDRAKIKEDYLKLKNEHFSPTGTK